jgi:hypothetical protein
MTPNQTRFVFAVLALATAVAVSARGKADDSASFRASTQTVAAGSLNPELATTLSAWPQASRLAAEAMIERYGQPTEITASMLAWRDQAPFHRTVVFRDALAHSFPIDHEDVLLQEVTLKVPLDKVDDLVRFDGSLLIDRTKGTVAARCDHERHNMLALNLAHDIIEGKRDVESARRFFADTIAKQMAGRSSPYTEKLLFSPSASAADPDRNLISE